MYILHFEIEISFTHKQNTLSLVYAHDRERFVVGRQIIVEFYDGAGASFGGGS